MGLQCSTYILYLIFPPLLLWTPNKAKKNDSLESGDHESRADSAPTAHSSRGVVFAFAALTLTLFRYCSAPELYKLHKNGHVPFLVFNISDAAEPLTYIFWYCLIGALVAVSFKDRPHCTRIMSRSLQDRMLVPEVLVLLVFCVADAAFVVVTDIDENDNGHLTLKQFEGNLLYAFWDILPRFWLMFNLCILISATVVGGISPSAETFRGLAFECLWPIIMAQLAACCIQRIFSRSLLIQRVLKHSGFLATACSLSILLFTHSLAMSMAVVFRVHENEHEVPSVRELAMHVFQKNLVKRLMKTSVFVCALVTFNWMIQPGMMVNPNDELLLLSLNFVVLLVALTTMMTAKQAEHSHHSWEACLIVCAGAVATFCWWATLLGPKCQEQEEEDSPCECRPVTICICAFTHVSLTIMFADIFRNRISPSSSQSILLTFWAGTTLCVGAKLEHYSAVEHERHHQMKLSKWEVLEHLGEFGLCEFGLISTVAWVTYLCQHAAKWWNSERKNSLTKPLLHWPH